MWFEHLWRKLGCWPHRDRARFLAKFEEEPICDTPFPGRIRAMQFGVNTLLRFFRQPGRSFAAGGQIGERACLEIVATYAQDFADFPLMTLAFLVVERDDLVSNVFPCSCNCADGVELVGT